MEEKTNKTEITTKEAFKALGDNSAEICKDAGALVAKHSKTAGRFFKLLPAFIRAAAEEATKK